MTAAGAGRQWRTGTEGRYSSMSERVKIGGIGKNPAIDKINSLKAIDIKGYAVRRMEQALQDGHAGSSMAYKKEISVSLERVEWEGKPDGREQGKSRMAGSTLSGRQIISKDSGKVWQAVRRVDGGAVPGHSQAAGGIQKQGWGQDHYL